MEEKERIIKLYNNQAKQYARLRKRKNGFDQKWRRELLAFARGNILEVSVGAGANFKFYPPDSNITGVDISPAMIEKAKEAAMETGISARFMVSAVEELEFQPQSFDTIVSTLSVCAYPDPVNVLQKMNGWCKKEGSILLMEHGQSSYKLLQWVQHAYDPLQYRFIGCHADRNILQVVQQAGLEITKCERKFMGIIYLVWAKPVHK
jgi:ubiquinone/menaquinone biosynthesis C-methylase UbiE